MSYYDTIEEDVARAKEILTKGKPRPEDFLGGQHDPNIQEVLDRNGGTIYGADTYAAYKLLESFVAEIERLNKKLLAARGSVTIAAAFQRQAEDMEELGDAYIERLRVGLYQAAKVLDEAAEIAGRNDVPQLSQSYAQAAEECRRLAGPRP